MEKNVLITRSILFILLSTTIIILLGYACSTIPPKEVSIVPTPTTTPKPTITPVLPTIVVKSFAKNVGEKITALNFTDVKFMPIGSGFAEGSAVSTISLTLTTDKQNNVVLPYEYFLVNADNLKFSISRLIRFDITSEIHEGSVLVVNFLTNESARFYLPVALITKIDKGSSTIIAKGVFLENPMVQLGNV